LSAALCPDPLRELTALPKPASWIKGEWMEGRQRKGREGRRKGKGKEGMGKEDAIPLLSHFLATPMATQQEEYTFSVSLHERPETR